MQTLMTVFFSGCKCICHFDFQSSRAERSVCRFEEPVIPDVAVEETIVRKMSGFRCLHCFWKVVYEGEK